MPRGIECSPPREWRDQEIRWRERVRVRTRRQRGGGLRGYCNHVRVLVAA